MAIFPTALAPFWFQRRKKLIFDVVTTPQASERCQDGVKGDPGDMPGLFNKKESRIDKRFANAN